MIDKSRLEKLSAEYGITLTGGMLDKLDRYAEILVDYNEKVNLTAITDRRGIEEKHFLDSLLFAASPYVKGHIADIGSGAGFPGVVCLIYRPELELTVIDPLQKRAAFLRYLSGELGIKINILTERAEEAAPKGWREKFDTATARAVANLPVLAEYCIPLVKVGGHFIAMKGEDDELSKGMNAINTLGAKYIETVEFTLPTAGSRKLIVCEKVKPTPAPYPRNGGKIKKKPL